ncbi:hypothetical protein [Streptomyces spectabilis]|uniref:Uncharacterized protein n=1 Tax=Streptomyces spectabilis TaxID=68270 RepID=A0A516RC86_STRST|nr:hypothetical protein [Streptomyces spectabilis]QDQ13265.1 hypothetical protein FH965_24065 [Streptomyces spectabilis]
MTSSTRMPRDTTDTGWGRTARGRVRAAAVGLTAAALLGGGLALVPAASAAPPDRDRAAAVSGAAPQGTAPACVKRSVSGRSATATNDCGRVMRVKIVVKHGPDSRCTSLKHRAWARHSWPFGSYDKTVTC